MKKNTLFFQYNSSILGIFLAEFFSVRYKWVCSWLDGEIISALILQSGKMRGLHAHIKSKSKKKIFLSFGDVVTFCIIS